MAEEEEKEEEFEVFKKDIIEIGEEAMEDYRKSQ